MKSHSHGVPLSLHVAFFSACHSAFCCAAERPKDWMYSTYCRLTEPETLLPSSSFSLTMAAVYCAAL